LTDWIFGPEEDQVTNKEAREAAYVRKKSPDIFRVDMIPNHITLKNGQLEKEVFY
jgi:hypothetical protein